jgi:hypothetical protein
MRITRKILVCLFVGRLVYITFRVHGVGRVVVCRVAAGIIFVADHNAFLFRYKNVVPAKQQAIGNKQIAIAY